MIDDIDFLPIKAKKRQKCYSYGCKNRIPIQFYITEWTLKGGNSCEGGIIYCEECILKRFPDIKRS